jgi:hypothetical protein
MHAETMDSAAELPRRLSGSTPANFTNGVSDPAGAAPRPGRRDLGTVEVDTDEMFLT